MRQISGGACRKAKGHERHAKKRWADVSQRDRGPVRSAFECASQNLRSILRYMHRDLQMPRETLKLQVDGILTSFAVEDAYAEQSRMDKKPEGPA